MNASETQIDMPETSASATRRNSVRRRRSFRRDDSGTALIEFAYLLPMLVALVSGGLETTNFVWTHTQVSELALHASDHASRMGRSAVLKNIPVTEADINDVLIGTALQGQSVDLIKQGRVIVSSLQTNATGGQWIAWQRCIGRKDFNSSYGREDDGKYGTSFLGMGKKKIKADKNDAVMFAEVRYQYKPLFPLFRGILPRDTFSETAAFTIREDRDLTQIYPVSGAVKYSC